jgi:hypothetical protein
VGIYRDPEYASRSGQRRWTLTAPGALDLLSWYHILWPAGVANRTTFASAKAETVIKALVQYNATASATAAAGRDRSAPLYGISIEADAARGNTIDWTPNRSHTLLDEIQGIVRIGAGDVDLIYTGATTRELRFYPGQRGTDKTTTIAFSERLGNVDNVRWRRTRSQERTVALVAGAGEGAARDTVVRTSLGYSSTNDSETFVDARNVGTGASAALQSAGDARLDEMRARDEFAFDVIQTVGTYYGPSGVGSYDLGDLVSARTPLESTVSLQVYGSTVEVTADGRESVAIDLQAR